MRVFVAGGSGVPAWLPRLPGSALHGENDQRPDALIQRQGSSGTWMATVFPDAARRLFANVQTGSMNR